MVHKEIKPLGVKVIKKTLHSEAVPSRKVFSFNFSPNVTSRRLVVAEAQHVDLLLEQP